MVVFLYLCSLDCLLLSLVYFLGFKPLQDLALPDRGVSLFCSIFFHQKVVNNVFNRVLLFDLFLTSQKFISLSLPNDFKESLVLGPQCFLLQIVNIVVKQ